MFDDVQWCVMMLNDLWWGWMMLNDVWTPNGTVSILEMMKWTKSGFQRGPQVSFGISSFQFRPDSIITCTPWFRSRPQVKNHAWRTTGWPWPVTSSIVRRRSWPWRVWNGWKRSSSAWKNHFNGDVLGINGDLMELNGDQWWFNGIEWGSMVI